jgi:chromatin segregation and condensation protein Rec8/ScpA/Scc1 (kleisin family)
LLTEAHSRLEIIVTLLALLEMIRDNRVTVRQEILFGPIVIETGTEPAPMTAPVA